MIITCNKSGLTWKFDGSFSVFEGMQRAIEVITDKHTGISRVVRFHRSVFVPATKAQMAKIDDKIKNELIKCWRWSMGFTG